MLILFLYINLFVYFYMMKIIESRNFKVYVFPNDHPPPHCHVIFNDGSEICVGILFIDSWYGGKISRKVRKVLLENIDELANAWDILNRSRIEAKQNVGIKK